MSTADEAAGSPFLAAREENRALSDQWRALRRAATLVAIISSPAVFLWLWQHSSLSLGWSIAATAGAIFAFRGTLDLLFRRLIPWPSLFATENTRLREEDVLNRRRATTWGFVWRVARLFLFIVVAAMVYRAIAHGWADANPWTVTQSVWHWLGHLIDVVKRNAGLLVILPFYFIFNFAILMGPLMLMGISQIRGFEPGDANWGVKLEDVRGQAEAKEEVRRIVNLWQSGEAFEKAGGRRERGILFHGAPGTGKTMLAKAIATGFNSPFVSIPGSGFAQTFIGIDALIVRWLARKAKKLASKWGGQCIVFIDEIDAVGMRRSSLGGAGGPSMSGTTTQRYEDNCFYGPWGALTPTGDLILETRPWRDKLFAQREPPSAPPAAAWSQRLGMIVNQAFPGAFGGGGMGQLALNQLLVTMDGIDNPPFWRRFWTNRINTILDATYVVPRRLGQVSLRLPPPRPTGNQIYFIGATNVPLEALDPALRRPGRMGRHVWFRTPTKKDREDIFHLYLGKVAHDTELDEPRARDELARITNGYSPAMVEQVCSMALTHAHHDGRDQFTREDIVEAMTTVESGTAIGVEYVPEETRAVAIHEAGHAAAAHVFLKGAESTRISIRMRAGSLGHHMALEKEERFSSWKHEEMAKLAWTLGAMAAEHVFYGENATGVGGDLQSATGRSAWMVGVSGMGPDRVELNGRPRSAEKRAEAEKEFMERFERLGLQLMNRASGDFQHDSIAAVLGDPTKRRLAAQIIGQAYVNAYNLVAQNKDAVERIAEALVERKEIYGDELVDLLNSAGLEEPQVDLTQETTWPKL
jgi:ATP-dependent Zn protease